MILTITAVSAVFVSSISVIIAVKKKKKQVEYNKKSIKPICSIYLTDNDNFISVNIENNGLGPAKIKDFTCTCDDGSKAETLYDLLPEELKHEVFHEIVRRKPDILVISANEKLYLICITPKNDETRQKFRNFLKNVTLYITYTDLYEEEYNFKRKLDFFGKDTGKQGVFLSPERLQALIKSM
jgi:hypothetical protein